MFYPEEIVEEVRSRNDIVDVISGYVKLQKKGANYFGLCPFHSEKSPSFSVSPGKQMYYCFGCGAGGNVITFLMEYENFTFPEAMKELADRAGVELPKVEENQEAREQADFRARLLEAQNNMVRLLQPLCRKPLDKSRQVQRRVEESSKNRPTRNILTNSQHTISTDFLFELCCITLVYRAQLFLTF